MIVFSVPVFLLLIVSLIPAFVGETHFAFLGYSLAHRLTPLRRELDYIRTLGTSKESAKETQLFALGQHLWDRFARANDDADCEESRHCRSGGFASARCCR